MFASAGQLGQPTVLRNNGDGTFSLAWLSSLTDINDTTGNDTRGNVAFGLRLDFVDFNGDGNRILFASNYRNNSFQVQTPWGENYGPNLAIQRDTTAPMINTPSDITTEAVGPLGTSVSFTATATDDVDGPVSVSATPVSGSTFPIGTTTVNLAATDSSGNASAASFTVTVRDTVAPTITPVADIIAEDTSPAGAVVTFESSATDVVGVTLFSSSVPSGSTFPIGNTTVNLTATDAAGNSSSSSFTVTVRDTVAPVISSLSASKSLLWPPNHKMVPITLVASASDTAGGVSLRITSVSSNEPDNGLGDGDTAGDMEITGDLTLNLRAERSGKRSGRTYTITVEATDAAGNSSTGTCTVFVPKSQGK